jgi:hypothetical protein
MVQTVKQGKLIHNHSSVLLIYITLIFMHAFFFKKTKGERDFTIAQDSVSYSVEKCNYDITLN